MTQKRLIIFLGVFVFFVTLFSIFSDLTILGATNQVLRTIVDDNIEVYIVVEGINVKEADNRIDAILIDPNGVVTAYAEITSIADNPIVLDELNIAFILANIDVFTSRQKLISTIQPGSTLSANQTFTLEDYLGLDLQVISGIYKFRYSLEYSINNRTTQMKGDPFYMKIKGNPLETVTGAVATVAVASSGISLLWVAYSLNKAFTIELGTSLSSSFIAPTNKLLSFYRAKSYKSVQNEISNAVYTKASSWRGDKCPLCSTLWTENSDSCTECQISREEAQKLYLKVLEKKSLQTSKELVDSTSGLSLYAIAQNLGEGIIPATNIISVLTSAGLTLVEPRVSHRMSVKTRRLIFTSLSTALLSVLWIQAVGFEVVSITMLLIAILTGTIPALIIRRALELNLKNKISHFFNQNTEYGARA